MSQFKLVHLSTAVALLLFCSSAAVAQNAKLIARSTFPSVVMLEMRDGNNQPLSLGSGFFVAPGVVATNFHVIKGTSYGAAKVIGETTIYQIEGTLGIDEQNDLALLKLRGASGKPLKLADTGSLKVGERVFALGNPQGLEGTISEGIVSGSTIREIGKGNLIQISASISPGSSGGPVVNIRGEVIGVASASLASGQNLNFAVPSAYISLLLARSSALKSLSHGSASEVGRLSDEQPSFSETVSYIQRKLEGESYTSGETPPRLTIVKSLRFSGCQMTAEMYASIGDTSAVYTTIVPVDQISSTKLSWWNTPFEDIVVVTFSHAIATKLVINNERPSYRADQSIWFPVTNYMVALGLAKAFDRAVLLCKTETQKEPF